MSFCYLLMFRVSVEKSAVILMGLPLYVTYLSLQLSEFFLCSHTEHFDYV
jgi:hypothetical protein